MRTLQRFLLICIVPMALAQAPDPQQHTDKIFSQEQHFLQTLATFAPMVETYVQEVDSSDISNEVRPVRDHYFLGRARYNQQVKYDSLVEKPTEPPSKGKGWRILGEQRGKTVPLSFLPRGFAQMATLDLNGFDAQHYKLAYVRREFVGELRTLVFDASPTHSEPGRFIGRLWVEERSMAIVRFNGTYVPTPISKKNPPGVFFHFDSWRVNPEPGVWIPSHVYIEEESGQLTEGTRFKAQTRFWDYAPRTSSRLDELTDLQIEEVPEARDLSAGTGTSPLEGQKAWERQAEDNVLSRLESGGILAPPGPVDEVLNGVVENLIRSSKLQLQARCRVLLTTPFETFSVGSTIVISRGLIDVLPDETSLALVLADELSHIALGHRTPTQFAFYNQTMLSDAELLAKLRLARSERELEDAGLKTIEIMRASPYQQTGAGLFLKALASRGALLPRLLAANLGNQVANTKALSRLAVLMDAAPPLEENKLEQISALPLGSRVKLSPWNNTISLIPPKPLSLLSAREKMPFEIAPFFEHLTLAATAKSAR